LEELSKGFEFIPTFAMLKSSRGVSRTLGLPNHAIQLANISIIITIHLLDKMKAHGFINLGVRLVSTRFKIAPPAFRICLLGGFSEQSSSDSFSLRLWKDNNNVAKVIAVRIGPYDSCQTLKEDDLIVP
jgi:hypothetical protein